MNDPIPAQNVSEMHLSAPQQRCVGCGTLFTPRRKWQRFHDVLCQKAFHRQKATPEAKIAALERRVAELEKSLGEVRGFLVI